MVAAVDDSVGAVPGALDTLELSDKNGGDLLFGQRRAVYPGQMQRIDL